MISNSPRRLRSSSSTNHHLQWLHTSSYSQADIKRCTSSERSGTSTPKALQKSIAYCVAVRTAKGSLGGHKGRPGFSTLLKRDNSSCIFRKGSVVQCLA